MAGRLADFLQHRPPVADNDALLRVLFHQNSGMNGGKVLNGVFSKMVDDYGGGIGQLIFGEHHDFFSDDFTGDKSLTGVGGNIFGKKLGALGQQVAQLLKQDV